ncbi:MAG: DUF3570 domain-containing protein [SAR324 cluster bacterium]|nr:DUF3570 domain-containing protein [SAR324 cluster bacterium]
MQLTKLAKTAGMVGCLAGSSLPISPNAGSAQEQLDTLETHYFSWRQSGGKGLQTFNGTEDETIVEPVIRANLNFGKRWNLNLKLDVDSISNASSSASEIHAASGASGHDRRTQSSVNVTFVPNQDLTGDRTFLKTGFYQSREYGYKSKGMSFGVSQEFLDRNFVLGGFLNIVEDRFSTYKISAEAISDPQTRKTTNLIISGTQLLTRKSLINMTLQWTKQRGYLARSLNSIPVRAGPRQQERLPESRDRLALRTQYNQFFGEQSAYHLIYRYYQDSFAVQAHTFQGKIFHELPYDFQIGGQLRYHTQTSVKYWGENFSGDEQYATSDSDLEGFDSVYYGADLSWKPTFPFSLPLRMNETDFRLNFALGQYRRSNGLQGSTIGLSLIGTF